MIIPAKIGHNALHYKFQSTKKCTSIEFLLHEVLTMRVPSKKYSQVMSSFLVTC